MRKKEERNGGREGEAGGGRKRERYSAGTCTRLKRFAAREVSTCRRAGVSKSGTGCRDTDLTNHKSRIMATYSSIPAVEPEQRRKLVRFGMLIN